MIIQSLQVLLPSYHSVPPLSVIPHLMRNPQYIPSSNIKKNGLPVLIGKDKEKKINTGSLIKDFKDDSLYHGSSMKDLEDNKYNGFLQSL